MRMSTLITFQHSSGSPSCSTQIGKKKRMQIGKEKVKLLLFVDNKILYTENPKDSTKKLLKLINDISQVAVTKLIYINLFHFYTLTTRYQRNYENNRIYNCTI